MSIELVPTLPGRPPIVRLKEGGILYLAVHDAEYLRMRGRFRALLAAAHPDHGGTPYKFRQTMQQRNKWLERETRFYMKHGFSTPDGRARLFNTRRYNPALVRKLLAAGAQLEEE